MGERQLLRSAQGVSHGPRAATRSTVGRPRSWPRPNRRWKRGAKTCRRARDGCAAGSPPKCPGRALVTGKCPGRVHGTPRHGRCAGTFDARPASTQALKPKPRLTAASPASRGTPWIAAPVPPPVELVAVTSQSVPLASQDPQRGTSTSKCRPAWGSRWGTTRPGRTAVGRLTSCRVPGGGLGHQGHSPARLVP